MTQSMHTRALILAAITLLLAPVYAAPVIVNVGDATYGAQLVGDYSQTNVGGVYSATASGNVTAHAQGKNFDVAQGNSAVTLTSTTRTARVRGTLKAFGSTVTTWDKTITAKPGTTSFKTPKFVKTKALGSVTVPVGPTSIKVNITGTVSFSSDGEAVVSYAPGTTDPVVAVRIAPVADISATGDGVKNLGIGKATVDGSVRLGKCTANATVNAAWQERTATYAATLNTSSTDGKIIATVKIGSGWLSTTMKKTIAEYRGEAMTKTLASGTATF